MIRALALAALFCSSAFAQAPTLPRNVVSVSTLGYWQHKSQSGTYRVVVVQDGWEHVWSRVFVEWLPEPKFREENSGRGAVVELVPPVAQGAFVLEAMAERGSANEILVSVVATSNMDQDAQQQRFVFSAREPGVAMLVRRSKR